MPVCFDWWPVASLLGFRARGGTGSQVHDTRTKVIEDLDVHIKNNTTYRLLKGSGRNSGADDADDADFRATLSTAQLSRVAQQATLVRMYLKVMDEHHPKWSVDVCAAYVYDLMPTYAASTVQAWCRQFLRGGGEFKRALVVKHNQTGT
jgi:hypothetical protein